MPRSYHPQAKQEAVWADSLMSRERWEDLVDAAREAARGAVTVVFILLALGSVAASVTAYMLTS